jgi:hypothetical protein
MEELLTPVKCFSAAKPIQIEVVTKGTESRQQPKRLILGKDSVKFLNPRSSITVATTADLAPNTRPSQH